ncbi:MAG: hypothetical protein V2B20_21355 [Pseudomonadota bacterium]
MLTINLCLYRDLDLCPGRGHLGLYPDDLGLCRDHGGDLGFSSDLCRDHGHFDLYRDRTSRLYPAKVAGTYIRQQT